MQQLPHTSWNLKAYAQSNLLLNHRKFVYFTYTTHTQCTLYLKKGSRMTNVHYVNGFTTQSMGTILQLVHYRSGIKNSDNLLWRQSEKVLYN